MCTKPLSATRAPDGSVSILGSFDRSCLYEGDKLNKVMIFNLFKSKGLEYLELPCRQCISCRLSYSRTWSIRIMHEAKLYETNEFVTLTYAPENLPEHGFLNYRDVQLFLKRLRKKYSADRVRFVCAGEYGEMFQRPHYHLILFNMFFADRKKRPGRNLTYTSQILSDLWGHGHCLIGSVTYDSAAYVARYITKKVNGKNKEEHYQYITEDGEILQRPREFFTMSRRNGIGADWLAQYHTDVFPSDEVFFKNKKYKAPNYYLGLYEQKFPAEALKIRQMRYNDASESLEYASPYSLHSKHLKDQFLSSTKLRRYEKS